MNLSHLNRTKKIALVCCIIIIAAALKRKRNRRKKKARVHNCINKRNRERTMKTSNRECQLGERASKKLKNESNEECSTLLIKKMKVEHKETSEIINSAQRIESNLSKPLIQDEGAKRTFDNNEVTRFIPHKNKEIPVTINCKSSDLRSKVWVILTHGAGGDLNSPQLKALADFLAQKDFAILRFTCKGPNIKYRITVFNEIASFVCKNYDPKRIFLGGRSMGARAAVMLPLEKDCNEDVLNKLSGIVCLSYPLHTVNELRDKPLLESKLPIFFLSGSIDEMCKKEVLLKVLKDVKAPYQLSWLEGYNHSAKSKSNFSEESYVKAFCDIFEWCKEKLC